MVDAEHSAFRVLSRCELEGMSDGDVQAMFRTHHVVVTDQFVPTLKFNEKGLQTLAELDKPVTLHGEPWVSSPPQFSFSGYTDLSKTNTYHTGSRHCQGTLRDLLHCQTSGLKIINGLDFPMAFAPHPPMAFASDLAAFRATLDLPFCGRSIGFPVMSSRWGLAATEGAHHLWHTDCDGFATFIDTQAGAKWWVVGRPLEPSDFSRTSLFSEKFEVDGTNSSLWASEAVLLLPGSRL
jgi:hypothetical protein